MLFLAMFEGVLAILEFVFQPIFFFFYDLRGWFFFCFLVWCEIWSSDWYQQGLSWSVLPALQPPVLSLYSGGKHQDIQPLLYSLHPKGFNLARSQCVSTELSILGHWPLGNRYGFAQRLSFLVSNHTDRQKLRILLDNFSEASKDRKPVKIFVQ